MRLSNELKEIIGLVAQGMTNKEIGIKLNYSVKTVERRISELFKLYNVKNRVQLTNEYMAELMANF